MADIKAIETLHASSIDTQGSVVQSSTTVEEPGLRRTHEEEHVSEQTLTILERVAQVQKQIASLNTSNDILNLLVSETKESPESILSNLSCAYFGSKNDFEVHLFAFRDSVFIANKSLPPEQTPLTLKSAYYDYKECRAAILKNLNVTMFEWSNTELTFLPPEIDKLNKATSIHLLGNKLSDLPRGIWILKALTKINLNDNIISSFSDEIGQLKNLAELYVMHNHLEAIPASIGSLINLGKLYIGGNQIHSLPDSLCHLENLLLLNIGQNKIDALPDSFGNLKNLLTLIAWDNQLTSLPSSFANLSNLTCLYLGGNQFKAKPPELDAMHFDNLNLYLNPYNSDIPDSDDEGYIEL